MAPKEPDYKRHGRERREEGLIRERTKMKSDMTFETARRIRAEECGEQESQRRYAEYEKKKSAKEAQMKPIFQKSDSPELMEALWRERRS